jgi:hypothetical protein
MKKINPLFAILIIAFWIGLYQINLVGQKLNNYGVGYNLTQALPWGMNAQQWVEDTKISLKNTSFTPTEDSVSVAQKAVEPINTPIETVAQVSQVVPTTPVNPTPEVTTLVDKQRCKDNCIILTIGDSIMGDVYYSLNRQLKKYHPDWKIVDAHKVSSGLSNSTYYNWPKVTQKLVQEIKPDYVIILIGMNDAQGLTDESRGIQFNTAEWNRIYKERAQNMLSIMSSKSTPVWIELPNVKADVFDKKLNQVREIHKSISEGSYVSVHNILGDNHNANFNKFRQNDGVHLNAVGADLVADYIYNHTLN